jgi:two-component system sensor histidine kinase CpxA
MLSQPWLISPYFRLPFILLISSVFLYVIVRYVTDPLLRLRAAAAHIGEGRLDTRVSPELAYRNDEIADLGRDFDRMACRIESLVNAQRQLLGNASHELRSPLSRLMIALALVKQGAREEVPEHLERIGLEARRLDKLIGQLLTLSRIESRADQGPPELLDLTHLVERVASDGDFEARAHLRRVVVMAADPCDVSGYDESLRSAIENVVRNAIRHTREGSTVEISLQRQQGPTCSKAKIHIRDYGPGVAEHLLTRVFQPFNRVPSDGQTSADGAGLGLAITESAVRAHGGTVRATNAVDGGLVVDIELPLPH